MAKSPAFLFYTNDFISGTQFFTDEQVGIFLRLLCAQHQHGHLSEKQVLHISKSYDNDVMLKFKKDDAGLFFNERLEIEIEKRNNYTSSRSNNKKGKTKTNDKHMKIISKSYDNHMENENEIDNLSKLENKKEATDFEKTFDAFIEMRKKNKKSPTDHAIDLIKKELERLAPGNHELKIEILNQSIRNSWQDVFPIRVQPVKSNAPKPVGMEIVTGRRPTFDDFK